MAPDLAGVAEIAEMLGVHKRTAQRYTARGDFPKPVQTLANGGVWTRKAVEKWAEKRRVPQGKDGAQKLELPRSGRPRKR